MHSYEHKRILIIGAGVSGCGVAMVLADQGAQVILSDMKSNEKLESLRTKLEEKNIEIRIGVQDEALLEGVDLLVLSPGIAPTIPIVGMAIEKNIPFTGEIEIAGTLSKAPILAVTGTNGKTTTTMLLGAVLRDASIPVQVGGNIGDALSLQAVDTVSEGYLVAEVSSYQLETICDFHANGAIVLNLTPDHLQRHKTMEKYQEAKENIFKHQKSTDVTVLNYDDPVVRDMATRTPGRVLYFSHTIQPENGAYFADNRIYAVKDGVAVPVIAKEDIQLPGMHNIENCMAVVALTYALGLSPEQIASSIARFHAVAHRIEYVDTIEGVAYYNDSKATNTDSVVKALESFTAPIHLILGGFDKGEDLPQFMDFVKGHAKSVICMGAAGQRFYDEAKKSGIESLYLVNTMAEALVQAKAIAKKGEIILLSPACSSFDQYSCFEERGDDFKEKVRQLAKGESIQ